MKRTTVTMGLTLALVAAGSGCSSLRVVEGQLAPPKWVADPAVATNYDGEAYVYASGISTYSLVLEEGIHDARHDAIRKLAEQVAIAAEDVYRADRVEKRRSTQENMPNVPQFLPRSHQAVDRIVSSVDRKQTYNPQATHTSQTRLHNLEQVSLFYSVWLYRPSLWARLLYGDTAVRFYDVYVLMRCPRADFEAAVQAEKALSFPPDVLPASTDVRK